MDGIIRNYCMHSLEQMFCMSHNIVCVQYIKVVKITVYKDDTIWYTYVCTMQYFMYKPQTHIQYCMYTYVYMSMSVAVGRYHLHI